jgi:hypothetical protein
MLNASFSHLDPNQPFASSFCCDAQPGFRLDGVIEFRPLDLRGSP